MNPSASYSSTELQIKKEKKNTINYKYLTCWLFAPQTMIQNLLVPFAAMWEKSKPTKKLNKNGVD